MFQLHLAHNQFGYTLTVTNSTTNKKVTFKGTLEDMIKYALIFQ